MRPRLRRLAPVLALVVLAILGSARLADAPAQVGASTHPGRTTGVVGSLIRTEVSSPERDAVAPSRLRGPAAEAARARPGPAGPTWSTVVSLLAALLVLGRVVVARWDAVRDSAASRARSGRSGAWATRAPPARVAVLPAA